MHCNIDLYSNLENFRIEPKELLNKLCEYDVVSFDVFDTLIFRPFTSPRVLFSIMEKRLGIYKFSKIRVDSEDEVRIFNQENYKHDNTTLSEIYNLISKKTNLCPKKTAQLEYELELNYCYANPFFQEIISECVKNKKKIIVCTDIYLSKQQIQEILKNNGYQSINEIYVSSELKRSKKKGDIYQLIKETYKDKKIIHIGDSYISDIKNAENSGVDTFYYKNINDIGTKNRISSMSYITGRIYSALINNHLYYRNTQYSEEYKLGYIYGGIYILGFVQWVNKFSITHNIDKILFLSRDGDVYSKMYDKLPNHKNWQYFYWSRLAGTKITAFENFYEFCRRMIWHKARGVYTIKIEHLLNFLGIEQLGHKLDSYNLSKDDILSKTTAQKIEDLFYDNKNQILNSFKDDIDSTIQAVKESVGNAKSIAIVDVGWAGTGPLILKNIIKNYLKLDCEVYSLLAGYRQPVENMAALYSMDGSIYSYLFSDTSNKDLLDLHINYGTGKNNLLLELFTQSCTPSFLGYTNKGLKFDRDELENYEIIKQINRGTEDFINLYINKFKHDSFLLNISAYDAYLPFNELKNSSGRLKNILSKLIISRGQFYDADNLSNETWLSFFEKD